MRPRYGIAPVGLACAVVAAVVAWREEARIDRLKAAMRVSDIPAVRVAGDAAPAELGRYGHPYQFTNPWFMGNVPAWDKALSPYKGKLDVRYLEVGAYEGRSLLWAVEHVLTHPTSRATAIDIFYGDYEARYRANVAMSGAADRVETIKAPSQVALRGLPLESYDIVYIDGSHATADVLEDAVLSWRLLKVGGALIFDDYQWVGAECGGHAKDAATDWPKPAIDAFYHCFAAKVEVVHNAAQLIVRKVAP